MADIFNTGPSGGNDLGEDGVLNTIDELKSFYGVNATGTRNIGLQVDIPGAGSVEIGIAFNSIQAGIYVSGSDDGQTLALLGITEGNNGLSVEGGVTSLLGSVVDVFLGKFWDAIINGEFKKALKGSIALVELR